MNETAAIVALGLLTIVVIAALVSLWRRPAATFEAVNGAGNLPECPPETIGRIFGSSDLAFVRAKVSPELRRAFQNERRAIAINWLWYAYDESRSTMSAHFKAARSNPDLRVSREAMLVAEYLLHQAMCLAMIGAVRAVGPAKLASTATGLAHLRRQLGIGSASSPSALPEGISRSSGLQTHI